ncbi:MAG: peptidase M48, partial [Pseudomonadota bacterium]
YFSIVPDPSNTFLATHPPNADRVRTVQQTAAGL